MRSNGTALSAGEWADSLTNVSVGDLLAEVPQDMDVDYLTPPVMGNTQCFQQTPFSCDSFDAAIAAHISRQQDKLGIQQCMPSHTSSIWDAEETCDAFSFQKNCGLHLGVPNISGTDATKVSKPITRRNSGCSADLDEVDTASSIITVLACGTVDSVLTTCMPYYILLMILLV